MLAAERSTKPGTLRRALLETTAYIPVIAEFASQAVAPGTKFKVISTVAARSLMLFALLFSSDNKLLVRSETARSPSLSGLGGSGNFFENSARFFTTKPN